MLIAVDHGLYVSHVQCSQDKVQRIFEDEDTRLTRLGDSISTSLRNELGNRITGRTNLMVRQTFRDQHEVRGRNMDRINGFGMASLVTGKASVEWNEISPFWELVASIALRTTFFWH